MTTKPQRFTVEEQDAGIHGQYAVIDSADGQVKRRTDSKREAVLFARIWNKNSAVEL